MSKSSIIHYVGYSTDDSFDSGAFARLAPDIFSPVAAVEAGWKSFTTCSRNANPGKRRHGTIAIRQRRQPQSTAGEMTAVK